MVDAASWDGSLSAREFVDAAGTLRHRWSNLNLAHPPWRWVHGCSNRHRIASHQEDGYLALEKVLILKSKVKEDFDQISQSGEGDIGCFEEEEEEEIVDEAALVSGGHSQDCYFDFHIVYSPSFRVPVLYFRAYLSNGQPILLDEIEKELPGFSSKVMLESKWTFITHEEHPVLNRPWYKLHPCGTAEWMKLLFLTDPTPCDQIPIERYLLSWLSVVGQVVGLKIPSILVGDKLVADDNSLPIIS